MIDNIACLNEHETGNSCNTHQRALLVNKRSMRSSIPQRSSASYHQNPARGGRKYCSHRTFRLSLAGPSHRISTFATSVICDFFVSAIVVARDIEGSCQQNFLAYGSPLEIKTNNRSKLTPIKYRLDYILYLVSL